MIHEYNGFIAVIAKIAVVNPIRERDPSIGWSYLIRFVDSEIWLECVFRNEKAAKDDRAALIEKLSAYYSGDEK